jgi:hypothetical protein
MPEIVVADTSPFLYLHRSHLLLAAQNSDVRAAIAASAGHAPG